MEKNYNQKIGKTTWKISEWYQKTYYVLGVIFFWWLLFSFATGFFLEIAGY